MSDLPPKLFRVADVAVRWACSNQTVYNLIRRGDLPAIRIGALYRVRPDDVTAYENREYPGATERASDSGPAAQKRASPPSIKPEMKTRDAFRLGQKVATRRPVPAVE